MLEATEDSVWLLELDVAFSALLEISAVWMHEHTHTHTDTPLLDYF